jgi:hypothetical protein
MSSPAYEIYFRTATFEDVEKNLCTFAAYRDNKGQSSWIYPPDTEHFDLIIEQDENDWDEFIQDDVDVEFFLTYFQEKSPSCSFYIEGRKWAGVSGIMTLGEIVIQLLTKFDGLFATEQQLFTLDDLKRWIVEKTLRDKVVDYRAINKTDDFLTRKRIALGIREALEIHCMSDPYFESGDEQIRRKLTEEIIELGEATIPVIAAWLESGNSGLVNDGAEIIANIGGTRAIDVLKKTVFESKVNSFVKHKAANELLKLVSEEERLEIENKLASQLHEQ